MKPARPMPPPTYYFSELDYKGNWTPDKPLASHTVIGAKSQANQESVFGRVLLFKNSKGEVLAKKSNGNRWIKWDRVA